MKKEWWRGGVIYQVYPRSYVDSNGDGIGDLPGITGKLEYIASLGVDAIWISPFFASPMKDFGYDVSNYRDVDPMFGTLEDFDALIQKAESLGLKIMVDMVISHTSDQHPWFKESRSNRTNEKADWYVWADPKPDGTPPNNWLSIFGGSAWEWDTGRRQYYMHNFLTCQPDLNFHHPEVRKALFDACEFWLERGVKGFRMDAVNYYFHSRQLLDNPPNEGPPLDYVPESNPYTMQRHLHDKTQPETLDFLEEFRRLLNRYPETASVGEMGAQDSLSLIGPYTMRDKRLHMVYTFHFLNQSFSTQYFRDTVEYLEARIGDGWPCWAFSNHDVARAVSRWNVQGADRQTFGMLLLAILGSMRGSICLYQGEELGLPEADIPFERLQDPYGIRFWPEFKGRDGCRTPMPWQSTTPNAGFSSAEPWLPVPDEHRALAVDTQEGHPDSLLGFYREFLSFRSQTPALVEGSIRFLETQDGVLGLERHAEGQTVLALFNLTGAEQQVSLPDYPSLQALPISTSGGALLNNNNHVTLSPWGFCFAAA